MVGFHKGHFHCISNNNWWKKLLFAHIISFLKTVDVSVKRNVNHLEVDTQLINRLLVLQFSALDKMDDKNNNCLQKTRYNLKQSNKNPC